MSSFTIPRRPVASPLEDYDVNESTTGGAQPESPIAAKLMPTDLALVPSQAPPVVPDPIYWQRVPDVFLGTSGDGVWIDNAQVHVQHNQQAYVRHEMQMQAVQPQQGRVADWHLGTDPIYTTAIANTGMSKEMLTEVNQMAIHMYKERNVRDVDWCDVFIDGMLRRFLLSVAGDRRIQDEKMGKSKHCRLDER
jgi:hypothetical protein